jgi:predicted HAD superfamily Cof-like phosphohydrolase
MKLNYNSNLIAEEYEELVAACDEAEALKEMADLVYVVYQLAAAKAWNLDAALYRVHKSNLSKLVNGKPLRREDGKVLKGPNYKPPYLDDLIQPTK